MNEFISKIVVFEADKSSGRREQTVDFYFNFIGKITLPGQNVEPEPFDPVEHRRAKRRENYYRNREQINARIAQKRAEAKLVKLAAEPIKSAEELSAEEETRRERKRAYSREYQREYRRKQREQKQSA